MHEIGDQVVRALVSLKKLELDYRNKYAAKPICQSFFTVMAFQIAGFPCSGSGHNSAGVTVKEKSGCRL